MSIVKNFQGASSSGGGGVQSVAVTDTDSVDLAVSGTENLTISANVKISADAGNSAEIRDDGVYVPTPAGGVSSVSVTDTDSIDLTISGSDALTISADVKISPDAGNGIAIRGNGLFAESSGASPGGIDGQFQYRVNSTTFGGAPLHRRSANAVDQMNGTNSQEFRLFRTMTDESNGEWLHLRFPNPTIYGTWAQILVNGNGSGGANIGLALTPRGNGAVSARVPDGTALGGNSRGSSSVDLQIASSLNTQVASGNYATLCGGERNTASGPNSAVGGGYQNSSTAQSSVVSGGENNISSGSRSAICGGQGNTSSGSWSTVCGGNSNQATQTSSFVGGGSSNSATGGTSVICGGVSNQASNTHSVVSGGSFNSASGSNSSVGGGSNNTASGQFSFVPGGFGADTRGIFGSNAYSGSRRASSGDNQHFGMVCQRRSSDDTPLVLTSDRAAVSLTNVLVLPNNSSWTGFVFVSARLVAGGDCASWLFWVTVKRGVGAATTTLASSVTISSQAEAGLSAASASVVAENSARGSLEVSAVGLAGAQVDWISEFSGIQIVA